MKNLTQFYKDSKFDFCKNLWKFIIAPILLVLVSIVLVATMGFNAGFDFTGGTTITVCSNDEGKLVGANIKQYDLSNREEYNSFISIIDESLEDNQIGAVSKQKTSVTILDLNIVDGNAVIIKLQNVSTAKVEAFKVSLMEKLGYDGITNGEKAVISGTLSPIITQESINLVIVALIVAIAVAFIYILIRFGLASAFSVVLGLGHDVLVMLCFAIILRLQVESWFLGGIIVLMMFSFTNNMYVFGSINNNVNGGKFDENGKYSRKFNYDVANLSIKETLPRQTVYGLIVLSTLCLVTIIASVGVRSATFPLIFGVVASIYSSVLVLPALWAIAYVPPKKKKVKDNKNKDEYVV